ncbi:unnamed protein product [Microthlaspi erraticum]|uniref:Uncharacterized protein n=1 Tax=Microthlaspi erraticum TaxID=1685480 RepID=A0A6D2KIS3_9BRAS|nr:unnamed protein product [Microthlaspi erraticum]
MDFIKTSSLRALIELTFQRNWNGLIWMSRKGVTTKRVKTVQTALSRISAQTAQRLAEKRVHARPNQIRPSEVSAKVQTIRPTHHDPGSNVPRSAKPRPLHAMPRTTMPREPGSKASRPRNLLTYHGRWRRPSREDVPRPAEKSANLHRPTTAADHESVRPRPFRSTRP